MLFYIPSILILIVVILIVFLVIPRLAPVILAVTALILLILGIYHHYVIFASEYSLSTWQEGLTFWAAPVMIALLILTIIGYFSIFLGSGKKINAPAPVTLPSANTATNPLTSTINTAMTAVNNIKNTVLNKVSSVVNSIKPPTTNKPSPNLNRSFIEGV